VLRWAVIDALSGSCFVDDTESHSGGFARLANGADGHAEGLLQASDLTDQVVGHDRHDHALCAGASSTSGAVQVITGLSRWVVVNHDGKVVNVDTASGHVSSYQGVNVALLDRSNGAVALGLRLVAV
jgi:hypothetical protein